jgi:hypothetical protein
MTTFTSLRQRLQEIAATASTAAEALDAGSVDFLPPEVARLPGALDGVAAVSPRRPARPRTRCGQGSRVVRGGRTRQGGGIARHG